MNTLYTQIYDSAKYLHNNKLKSKINCILRGLKTSNVRLSCQQFGISRRTYYYWLNKLKENDFDPNSLMPKSRAPKRSPRIIEGRLKEEILNLRKEFRYGPATIAWYMDHLFGIKVSPHGVYKVLLRENVPFRKRRSDKPNPHKRRYSLNTPGEGLQVDIKYVPFKVEGEKAYVYNAIDDCSRWRFAYLYRYINTYSSKDFAKRLIKAAPFTIKSVQTDNDVAFTNHFLPKSLDNESMPHPFTDILEQTDVSHKLIPPGAKELNGKVERSHKTDMEEFFWKIPTNITFDNLQNELSNWIHDYNHNRPHSELGMKSPVQKLSNYGFQINSTKRKLKKRNEEYRLNNPPRPSIVQNILPSSKNDRKNFLEMALIYSELSKPLPPLCNFCGNTTWKKFKWKKFKLFLRNSSNNLNRSNYSNRRNRLGSYQTDENRGGGGGAPHHLANIVNGDYNTVEHTQKGKAGHDGFIEITGDSNTVDLYQRGNGGQKWADIVLDGDGHSVDVDQRGSNSASAAIDLTNSGGAYTLDLDQNVTTSADSYSITGICATFGGCSVTINRNN